MRLSTAVVWSNQQYRRGRFGSPEALRETIAGGPFECQCVVAEPAVEAFRNAELGWGADLPELFQNDLLDESGLIRFVRSRGIRINGTTRGDPSLLCEAGLLRRDGVDPSGQSLFHPFRIYAVYRVLKACTIRPAPSASLDRERLPELLDWIPELLPSLEVVSTIAEVANEVCDLLILLEPAYWPNVAGVFRWPGLADKEDHRGRAAGHREDVVRLVADLDHDKWRRVHEDMRLEAAELEGNHTLYLLLRLAPWEVRNRLEGQIGGALWIRHMAEVLRRAFEEATNGEWPEEDEAFGSWPAGARVDLYGSDRPLDRPLASKPYLAREFGLFTGSVVRWYVEGATEVGAVEEILPDASIAGIELVDLRGNFEDERGNVAMNLGDALLQDLALRRFSIISFDLDVPASVRSIRRQIEQDRIVGFLAAHDPDFEFANFTIDELVEVASAMDERAGFDAAPLRSANWDRVVSGRSFEEEYLRLSARRPRSLKGREWGRVLARYAVQQPRLADGTERPLIRALTAALRSRIAAYDHQRERFRFDPDSFLLVERDGFA
ncbi:hypothetical protein [Gaopeijia maritima]|uniref:Uncharacterized protein n=1 Tax=Gaopeijia maritima TaxID=3119007 RepID=A0ABU9ECX4_9BACT